MTTVAWILFWTLIWPVAALLIDRLVNPRTPERRVARLLGWYPRRWRERHGEPLAELLHDAIADGRDGPRLSLDVAREGVGERLRSLRASRVAAGFLIGTGWTMVLPQGIVAAILGQFGSMPPSWFVALHVGADARWLVIGLMIGLGVLLLDRGYRIAARDCRPRAQSAG